MGRMMFVTVVGFAALVGATESKADPIQGKIVKVDTVQSRHVDSWKFGLRGTETTRIQLAGDGDTCLELRVFDENGNLVASDTVGMGDRRGVLVHPKWTGKFLIQIRNLGHMPNHYVLVLD